MAASLKAERQHDGEDTWNLVLERFRKAMAKTAAADDECSIYQLQPPARETRSRRPPRLIRGRWWSERESRPPPRFQRSYGVEL